MVLGLRSKTKRFTSVQVEYFVEVLEIKPWPASQSQKSIRSVVLQWENGDRNFGLTNPITPSLAEEKIEINESFRLQVTLMKESSGKNNDNGGFHKNILQLHLHEPKKDKTVKGQLLGTAILDMAQHGIIKDSLRVGVPMNFKRSFRNITQPVLYIKLQSFEKNGPESSSRDGLSKKISLDRDGKESVSTLMSEEYAEEDEIASFTDDDVSSHSSLTNSSSLVENNADLPLQTNPGEQSQIENLSKTALKEDSEEGQAGCSFIAKPIHEEAELEIAKQESILHDASVKVNDSSAQSSPVGLSVDHEAEEVDGDFGLSKSDRVCLEAPPYIVGTSTTCSLSSHHEAEEVEATFKSIMQGNRKSDQQEDLANLIGLNEEIVCKDLLKEEINAQEKRRNTSVSNSHLGKLSHEQRVDDTVRSISDVKSQENSCSLDEVPGSDIKPKESCKEKNVMENGSENVEEVQSYHLDSSESFSTVSVASGEPAPEVQQHEHMISGISIYSDNVPTENVNGSLSRDRRRSMSFLVRSPLQTLGSNGNGNANKCLEDMNEIGVLEDVSNGGVRPLSNKGAKETIKNVSRINSSFSDSKVHELECRVEMLEGELREAAAIEMGLYSVVAEHGSSVHKVHTPARRLSRLYLHASKLLSRERRAGAARSAVSGLVMVAKACGNDLPRLTFWLSNLIVLRAIVSHARQSENPKPFVHFITEKGTGIVREGKKFSLKWESIPQEKFSSNKDLDDWEDPQTFVAALEKIEAWIFSRIVESLWWQTFTPYMQSSKEGVESKSFSKWKKRFERESNLDKKMRKNYSFEIWKKAFQDAYERLCPVRGEGHKCGCLSILAKLVMEQCVARLDVALFNALLHESVDETLTDPVADPIINHKVLPVPPGKSSFGAGAQLKNAIGNWSRSLTDLFDMDADDSSLDVNDEYDEKVDVTSLKSFHLLNALSDLFMLPKDMLLEKKVREEVCATFSSSVIRRILSSFFPDEFCPDQVPASVFDALDSEDQMLSSEDGMVRNLPCGVFPISYSPPSAASIQNIIGDLQSTSQLKWSGSSVVRKCHASDDDLKELDSPLSAIILDKSSFPSVKAKEKTSGNPFRYQLLRDVWKFND